MPYPNPYTPEQVRATALRAYATPESNPNMPALDDRPDIGNLYEQLVSKMGQAPDYSGLERVAKARHAASQNDLAAGMALSSFGGEALQPFGAHVFQQALAQGQPMRPNAADIGYENPETGEFTENPVTSNVRDEKMLAGRIDALVKEQENRARIAQAQNNADDLRISKQNLNALTLIQASIAQQNANTAGVVGAAKAKSMGGAKFVPGMVTPDGGPVYRDPSGAGGWLDGQGNATAATTATEGTKRIESLTKGADDDAALGEIIKQVEANPGAFELGTAMVASYLPSSMQGRALSKMLTPAQLGARNAVYAQAYQTIHDLAGATLARGEEGRITQFTPDPADPADVIISKLKQARHMYQVILKEKQSRAPITPSAKSVVSQPLIEARPAAAPTPIPAQVLKKALGGVEETVVPVDEGVLEAAGEPIVRPMRRDGDVQEQALVEQLVNKYLGGLGGKP